MGYFYGLLNKANEVGTGIYNAVNQQGTEAFNKLNDAYEALDNAVDGRLPYGIPESSNQKAPVRKAAEVFGVKLKPPATPVPQSNIPDGQPSDAFVRQGPGGIRESINSPTPVGTSGNADIQIGPIRIVSGIGGGGPVRSYIENIEDKGGIPLLNFNSPMINTAQAYAKSLAGPLGRPFRIMGTDGTRDFYQQTVDAADFYPETGELIFNSMIENKDEYNRLGQSFINKDIGRYVADVDERTNKVYPVDDFDTNQTIPYHASILYKGRDLEGNPKKMSDRAISGASLVHKSLDNLGWTNDRPFGNRYSIGERIQ
tara:strand:- start:1064 stop:2005 length:942 start_codon:yes stop_codon:yes gene_type:complete